MKRFITRTLVAAAMLCLPQVQSMASSHREAPLIANDPQADNTDLYMFRSPHDTNKVVIIANFIPLELPQGGPNYYTFGENINYDIHIKNNAATSGDDILYRFTFQHTNQDPTTFFNIRAGKQNLKTTYILQISRDNGNTFTVITTGGIVPPNNIGPKSIEGPFGLKSTYDSLMQAAVQTYSTGETVFCGPVDDPFFVDLGGIFDLGNFRRQANGGRDAVAKFNCHSIVMEIPIRNLQKTGLNVTSATSILDPNFVIGVWASTSRPSMRTLNTNGTITNTGNYVQISRIGMPLTNEAIIPIGMKDFWNTQNPANDIQFAGYFKNPELALYMDSSQYGPAVPGLDSLRIQTRASTAVGNFDFRNNKPGLYPLKGNPALIGTAFDPATYGNILLPDNVSPRSVDILPIFFTGVPNLAPYQLATGKAAGNPLSAGKPFINNFLPTLGDYLRLNMAVPVTPRHSPDFNSLGLVWAAVLGITDSRFNTSNTMQNIPNMDGFPNGRRLEDDITTIELQAVSGVVLAAIGLYYDDYTYSSSNPQSPLTPNLLRVVGFDAGITHNDTTFRDSMPYEQAPWRGFNGNSYVANNVSVPVLNVGSQLGAMVAYPNPFASQVTFRYKTTGGNVTITVTDITGRVVKVITEGNKTAGDYNTQWNASGLVPGNYVAHLSVDGVNLNVVKLAKTN